MRHLVKIALLGLPLSFLSGSVLAESSFLLQLGSFPDEAAANKKWDEIGKSDVLKDLDKHLSEIDIGNGQKLYRLQAGPVADRKVAAKDCATLQAQKQDCYVVETAVLSGAAPVQGLTAVQATQSTGADELQIGADADGDSLIRVDTAMPRMDLTSPPVAQKEAELSNQVGLVESGQPTPPPADAPTPAPEPAKEAPKPAEQAAAQPTPPAAPEWNAVPAPSAAARAAQPTIALDSAPNTLAPQPEPTVSSMGSLGKLRLNKEGAVVGATPVEHAAAAAIVPTPPAAPEPAPVPKRQVAMTPPPPAPAPVDLLPPPAPGMAPTQATAPAAPVAAPDFASATPAPAPAAAPAPEPEAPSAMPVRTETGPRALSLADAKVSVKEAIPVQGNASMPVLRAPAAPQALAYAPPAAWRGTPSGGAPADSVWAQFGQFANESAAFGFFDQVRSRAPDLANGVRVRALRPYESRMLGAKVALRVGPYRSGDDVNRLCALVAQQGQPCKATREVGGSTALGGNRLAASSLQEQNPFGAPTPKGFGGHYFVQLGSYGSPAEAYNHFTALQSRMPDAFVGIGRNVSAPRASSGRAPTYRLRAGPFNDVSAARGFCTMVGQRGVPCLLVED